MSDERYELSKNLAEAGEVDAAWKIINQILTENPTDPRALVTGSFLMRRAGHLPESYHFAKAATKLIPNDAAPWINLGHVASEMWLTIEAEACYRRALKCDNIDVGTLKRNTLLNISALYIDNARYEEARKFALEMLESYPNDEQAKANLGFCQLAGRDWSGWKNYRYALGSEWRPKTNYGSEPEWDGTPGLTVALYGEQGIGDEISFASMLDDAAKVCKKLILECDPRLAGLFKRSFPRIKVYGTRTMKAVNWAKEDQQIDASLALGQIGEYFRTSEDQFPGTPYLIPCPQRSAMWKAFFEKIGKPVIGVAWRGGIPKSNAKNRQWTLEDLLPLFRGLDAHFVSLQYKDASREIEKFLREYPGIDLVQYPWGTLTKDYDDTAALISALDHVFCMQTAVAHTAGALGVPVTVCVPKASQWRYGNSEDTIPWYKSLRVVRQKEHGSWRGEIKTGVERLQSYFPGISRPAGADAESGSLRGSFSILRPDGIGNRRANGGSAPT